MRPSTFLAFPKACYQTCSYYPQSDILIYIMYFRQKTKTKTLIPATLTFPLLSTELPRRLQHITRQRCHLLCKRHSQWLAPKTDWSYPLPHLPTPTSTTMKLLIKTLPIGFHFLILGRPIKKVSNCDYTASGSITLDVRQSALFETYKK